MIDDEKIFNESDYMYSDYENGLVEDNEYKYKTRETWDGLRTYEGKLIRSKRELEDLKIKRLKPAWATLGVKQ